MEGVLNIELGGICEYKYFNNILELNIRNTKSNYFNIYIECLVLKNFNDLIYKTIFFN